VSVLLPLYAYPLDDPDAWATACRLGMPATVIVNVHNGPGSRYDAAYGYATAALAAARVPMLGYVDLDYAARPVSQVHDDIARWRLYPVRGLFFDRAPSGSESLAWVGAATAPVRGRVVLNPGTRPHPDYAALADLVCTFEGPWLQYRLVPAQPDWPNAAHLVYGVPLTESASALRRLRSRVSHGLITDHEFPLPYSGLPTSLRQPARMA
jgi:hypothetical protein